MQKADVVGTNDSRGLQLERRMVEAMRRRISAAILASVAAGCDAGDQADYRDRAMREMNDITAAASSSLIVVPATTPAQRALLLENLIEKKPTYMILSSSAEDLGFLQDVHRLIDDGVSNDNSLGSEELDRIMKRTSDLKSIGATSIGFLSDAGRRQSVLFKLPSGKLGMLSVWDYKADDGKILALEEARTFEVAGVRASLSLSKNSNDDRRLWVVGWTTDSEDYGLYLEDAKTEAGDTHWNPDTIRELAEEMTR